MQLIPDMLEDIELFADLSHDQWADLAARARIQTIKAKQTLFERGDTSTGCFIVLEGTLEVVLYAPEQCDTLVALIGAGQTIGEMGVIDGEPRSTTVRAVSACRLAHISASDFRGFADANPEVYRAIIRTLNRRLRETNDQYFALQSLPLHGRLARVLIGLSNGFGERVQPSRILIRQIVTQSDLARMTGSARENVNRQIRAWVEDNTLSKVSRYYCIEQFDQLCTCAGLNPEEQRIVRQ